MGLKRARWLLITLALVAASPALAQDALRGHGGPVKSVAVSPDGRDVLTGSFDYSMIHWRPGANDPVVSRFTDHDAAVNSVAFVPGGARAVSASDDGTVAVWDLDAGRLIKRFTGHDKKVVHIAVSVDGRLAGSASWDRTARLWNLETLEAGPVLKGHANTINAIAFSPDGRFVYTGGYAGQVRRWRTSDGALDRVVHRFGWGINVLAVLAGGKEVLFGALDGSVGVIDVHSGEVIRNLPGHDRPVLSMALAFDRHLAATGDGGGAIQVFDTETWQVKYRHDHAYGPVWGMAITAGGTAMYFAGLDDHVTWWRMKPDKAFQVAPGKVPRRFQVQSGADPGALQFARKCSICHTLEPGDGNRAGPSLFGIIGRKVGTLPGYNFSAALKQAKFIWNEHTIDQLFAQGPENFLPGTKMPLQKMDNAQDRKALVQYLKTATGGFEGGE